MFVGGYMFTEMYLNGINNYYVHSKTGPARVVFSIDTNYDV